MVWISKVPLNQTSHSYCIMTIYIVYREEDLTDESPRHKLSKHQSLFLFLTESALHISPLLAKDSVVARDTSPEDSQFPTESCQEGVSRSELPTSARTAPRKVSVAITQEQQLDGAGLCASSQTRTACFALILPRGRI